MKSLSCRILCACLLVSVAAQSARAQFEGYLNKGLFGVGRVPANSFDRLGTNVDTLGGIFSAMALDPSSVVRQGGTYSGTLYGLPDRGFGDGAQDFRARIQVFAFSFTPYVGAGPVSQNQITLSNSQTILLTYDQTNYFTGFDPADASVQTWPQSRTNSLGGGRRAIDAEGIVLAPGGAFFISDEYGPAVFKFSASGDLEATFLPPPALVPKNGAGFPRTNNFNGATAPASGRRNNRGLEGLTILPGGTRLAAVLQSPTIQDGGGANASIHTRLLVWDIVPASATYGTVVSEFVYPLTLNGSAARNRHTPLSELIAVNSTNFLALERDGIGLGAANGSPIYKRVVAATISGATNIVNTAYDLELGAPGAVSLPATNAVPGVATTPRSDLIDLLDLAQLSKFGLNTNAVYDQSTVSEKWEGLALFPVGEPENPDDFFLLVGNDNDFKATNVWHNGVIVGTNDVPVDSMVLAYRVTLPGFGSGAPANRVPSIAFASPTNATLSVPALDIVAAAYDVDGLVTRVEFFTNGVKAAEKTLFPFTFSLSGLPPGAHTLKLRVTDNTGATAETADNVITLTAGNQAPTVAITSPSPGVQLQAGSSVLFAVSAADFDGAVTRVEFFRNGIKLGEDTNAPFSLNLVNTNLGFFTLTAVARDNQGATNLSASVSVEHIRATTVPLFVQVLHASDFEAGIPALDDARRFSSVLNALRGEYAANTLTVSSGDNYIPGPFFTASADPALPYNGIKGRADILLLNAFGIQASALGNHEFDDGTATVRDLIRSSTFNFVNTNGVTNAVFYPGAQFPYLSANLNFAPDANLAASVTASGQDWRAATNRVTKSTVVTVAGERIGIVGATTIELRQISSPGNIGVITNLVGEIQPVVDALLGQGINKIILLTHLQQHANEFALATRLTNVDVIIAGGSHTVFAKPTDRLRDDDTRAENYPVIFNSPIGEPVHVVNSGPNYRYVSRLIASFNSEGIITSVDNRSGAYATDDQGVADTGSVAPTPAVTNILAGLAAVVDSKDGVRFGKTTVYLNGLRESVRTEEANLGSLSADANIFAGRAYDPSTSISIKNGGGIRDAIGGFSSIGGLAVRIPPVANPRVGKLAGEISQLDIENSLRFNNGLALITLTAQQLRDAMEWGVSAWTATATPGQFPQVGGIWMAFQPTNQPMTYFRDAQNNVTGINNPGQRIRSLVARNAAGALDLVVENGQLVGDPNRTFRCVTLDFLASGGDTYYPLTLGGNRTNLVATNVVTKTIATPGSEQKALADYLTAIGTYTQSDTPREFDRRIENLLFRTDDVGAPEVTRVARTAAGLEFQFTTLPGKLYAVEYRDSFSEPWTRVGFFVIAGDGQSKLVVDPQPTNPNRFFRFVRTN